MGTLQEVVETKKLRWESQTLMFPGLVNFFLLTTCIKLLLTAHFRTICGSSWPHCRAHPSTPPAQGREGVSITQCDAPCPITTENITSFNLYNTCIDPSGCYHAAIAARGWAQLSFRDRLNPLGNISERQRDPGLLFLLTLSFSPDHFVCWMLGRCVTGCFLTPAKITMEGMRYDLCTVENDLEKDAHAAPLMIFQRRNESLCAHPDTQSVGFLHHQIRFTQTNNLIKCFCVY